MELPFDCIRNETIIAAILSEWACQNYKSVTYVSSLTVGMIDIVNNPKFVICSLRNEMP